jgi:hypothetical protein
MKKCPIISSPGNANRPRVERRSAASEHSEPATDRRIVPSGETPLPLEKTRARLRSSDVIAHHHGDHRSSPADRGFDLRHDSVVATKARADGGSARGSHASALSGGSQGRSAGRQEAGPRPGSTYSVSGWCREANRPRILTGLLRTLSAIRQPELFVLRRLFFSLSGRQIRAVNKPIGDNARKGAVRERSQLETKIMSEKHWTKRSKESGQFIDQKYKGKFKSVRQDKVTSPPCSRAFE